MDDEGEKGRADDVDDDGEKRAILLSRRCG